jgi:hypothetical protein
VLEQQPITFLTLLDLLRGVLDGRLHPTEHVLLARRRSAAISYICVFPLFLLFLFVLVFRPGASPFSGGSRGGPGSAGYIFYFTSNSSVMQASSQMIVWSALVDGVAFLVSGLLLAGTLMRSALGARRTWVRLLAALPVLVELLALVGLGTLLVLLFALQNGIDDGNISLGLGLMAILLGAVTSLVLAYVEVFRKKLTRRIALVALIPATVGTFAMLGVWIAYLIWGITICSSVSALIPEGSSFLSSPFQDWQRAWEMNLFLLALPTAYVLWRWFLALFTKTTLVTQS